MNDEPLRRDKMEHMLHWSLEEIGDEGQTKDHHQRVSSKDILWFRRMPNLEDRKMSEQA